MYTFRLYTFRELDIGNLGGIGAAKFLKEESIPTLAREKALLQRRLLSLAFTVGMWE